MLEALLFWVIIGGIAGWLASIVVRGGGFGLVGDIIVGVVGALIGGFLMSMLGGAGVTGFNLYSIFVAFIGAVVLLFIVRLVSGNSSMRSV
jgi:uncharacterized membrane protein YeaQ/YmgE (transglycosylase-associated protein family)